MTLNPLITSANSAYPFHNGLMSCVVLILLSLVVVVLCTLSSALSRLPL